MSYKFMVKTHTRPPNVCHIMIYNNQVRFLFQRTQHWETEESKQLQIAGFSARCLY